jgi:hypothetical protein
VFRDARLRFNRPKGLIMANQFGDREEVLKWKSKIVALRKTAETVDDQKNWLAGDIAMIEAGIYGMLAMMGNSATKRLLEAIMQDILSAHGDPAHWRNQ